MKSLHPLVARWLSQTGKLVPSGRLKDAGAIIQNALRVLQPHPPPAPASSPTPPAAEPSPVVLDGLVREVRGDTEPPRPHHVAHGQAPAGEFSPQLHTSAAGIRAYKLYVPSGYEGKPLPLIVMLHGCTQDPDDFARGTRMNELAQEHGFLALYPAQAQRSNNSKCWNWFQPADQRRGGGEPALLADMTRHVIATQAVDPDRVYVAGLSAGGAMAAILGREYPDLFAAIGVHSGLAHGAAHDIASAFAAMKGRPGQPRRTPPGSRDTDFHVPAIVFHGDADGTVHPSNGRQVIDDVLRASAGGATPRTRNDMASGRLFTHSVYPDAHGRPYAEHWEVHGAGHAWSGGSPAGSYADAKGPDASREMLRFFWQHRRSGIHR